MRATRCGVLVSATISIALIASSCSRSPVQPGTLVSVEFPTPLVGQFVACATCTAEPKQWISAEFPVTVANNSDADLTVATATAVVVNASRGNAELGRGTRPNRDFPYTDVLVRAHSTLTLPLGVVYFPVPQPTDDVRIEVTVTFSDGRTASRTGTVRSS